ncbi:uncharacterized protein LOC119390529 isoform X2 [Rhipicephalus sanguineus]|uniref:uncharacterized protein LOC119390529 isoform X2 n=1 Tax=Rhipicephalus sanguineus TaxID=34632 RepID=UPI001895B47A|nr:uncharacterized protein LOC119390529 isoform X2 [Rhipicephalus sanguineus]
MALVLPATCTALDLREMLTINNPLTVHHLNLTNCVIASQDGLCEYTGLCSNLQSLECVACPILVSKLLWLLQERLPQLEELAFSLSVPPSEITKEVGSVLESLHQVPRKTVNNLRSVYVEMRGDDNAVLLLWLLVICPNVTDIHVHLASGDVRLCLLQMERIVRRLPKVREFTFSSDVPATVEDEPFPATLFNRCALVCANVRVSNGLYNCVWLRELVRDPTRRGVFTQLVLVFDKRDDLAHRIAEAALGHDWTNVCCLTLVLAPKHPSAAAPQPMAEGAYFDALRVFFSAFTSLEQLNINSFHFGVDIDVTRLLRYAGLVSLKALSTPPCGLSRRHAVRRLADACPGLVELDVRVEQRGTQLGCTVCQKFEFRLDKDDMDALQKEDPPRSRRLTRLTLSGVLRLESLLFLEHCKVDELRLVDCADVSHFMDIGKLLARSDLLSSLLIRNEALPFGRGNFLHHARRKPEVPVPFV